MAKPMVHAKSSAKRFGGKPTDYLDIHQLIDSSREAFPDLRHRALTHNSWFITKILVMVFGETRKNSANITYSVRDVGEFHVIEDFRGKFMPSAQDYLQEIEFKSWMDNGGPPDAELPPSRRKLKDYHPSEVLLASEEMKITTIKVPKKSVRKFFEKVQSRTDAFSQRPCAGGPPGTYD